MRMWIALRVPIALTSIVTALGCAAAASRPAPTAATAQPRQTSAAAPPSAPAPRVPQFQITTTDRFDAASIPRYGGSHDAIYAHIDQNRAAHLEQLRRWVRQPSISAENRGIQEMATMLRDDLRQLGFQEAELVPTSGHPGVWGFYDAGAPKTLAVYMMYDVQPVEPRDWRVSPFDGAIVDHDLGRVLMARGAVN